MASQQQGDNFFVKDYEPLRQTLMTLFLYGCYDREQLRVRMQTRGYRYSSRRCDSLLQIVRYFWRDAMQAARTTSGKKIHYFPAGRYRATENSLWRMYGMKSMGERDVNLFFFLPCAVRRAAIQSGNHNATCTTTQVGFQISKDTGIDDFLGKDMMIWRAAKNLKSWDFLSSDSAKRICTVGNILDGIAESTLRELYELLFFYRDILPLGSLGYSLQQTIRDYLVYERGVADLPKEGIFVHKDVFFQNILNDEVLFQVQTAMEGKRRIGFQCDTAFPNQRRSVWNFLPLKFIFDLQYGRQYVFGELPSGYRLYRLDKMSKIYWGDAEDKGAPLLCPALDKIWLATCDFQEEHTVVVDFDFSAPAEEKTANAQWLVRRLKLQKRMGTVTETSPKQCIYSVVVHNPIEMIPWIRSWAPYARVRREDNPELAEKLEQGWLELLLRYKAKKQVGNPTTEAERHAKIAYTEEAKELDKKMYKKPAPSLFLEYRNLYNCAIHAAMHSMNPKQYERHSAKWTARDLVRFITSYSRIDNTADKYLNAIATFGKETDAFSLFRTESTGYLHPAYPGPPPPIMPGLLEKRYLRTLMDEEGIQALFSEKEVAQIKELLKGVVPFAWKETIEERGANEQRETKGPNPAWKNIRTLMSAIRRQESLAYTNRAHNGFHHGTMKPYRIMYSPQERIFQVITASTDETGERPRLVLMNIRQLSQLAPAADDSFDVDVNELIEEKKQPPLHLVVRPRVGMNDVERAFFLFSNYERMAWYDDEKNEYHVELVYYSFQFQNEILPRILSLGAAVEVLSPQDIREKIIGIVSRAANNNSHLF